MRPKSDEPLFMTQFRLNAKHRKFISSHGGVVYLRSLIDAAMLGAPAERDIQLPQRDIQNVAVRDIQKPVRVPKPVNDIQNAPIADIHIESDIQLPEPVGKGAIPPGTPLTVNPHGSPAKAQGFGGMDPWEPGIARPNAQRRWDSYNQWCRRSLLTTAPLPPVDAPVERVHGERHGDGRV